MEQWHTALMHARFYLYSPDGATARAAAPKLEQERVAVATRLGADAGSWLALGSVRIEDEGQLDEFEERFEALAGDLGGENDGYDRD